MPTLPGFMPYNDDGSNFKPIPMKIKASQVADLGDALSAENAGTTGELEAAVTDDFILAVYYDKPRASTDSDYASIVERLVIPVIHGPQQLWSVNVETGTAAHATETWDYGDLASADGLTLTDTNKDFRIVRVVNSTTVIGYFASFTTEPSA